jgi:hypothetical protein
MTYRSILLFVPLFIATLLLPGVPARIAFACSGGFEGDYRERIDLMYHSELVLAVALAEVTDVRAIGPGAPLFVLPAGTIATFRPEVLWSNLDFAGNTIGPLGYVAPDCSGGPRLETGDRVLLFLMRSRYGVASYSIGAGGDTILFRGEKADYPFPSGYMVEAGSTREVIDYLLSIVGSPETTSGPAWEFVGLE